MGLEPTKTGFADQCLDRFGIATSEKSVPKSYTPNCTQTALAAPIYPVQSLRKLLKPRGGSGFGRFCRPLPYHLATAPRCTKSDLVNPASCKLFSVLPNSRRRLWASRLFRSRWASRSGCPIQSTNHRSCARCCSPANTSTRTRCASCVRRCGSRRLLRRRR